MEVIKSLKKVFRKSFCSICLTEARVSKLDKLDLCSDCWGKIKKLESEEPVKISKEQTAGGIKNEL
jgi:5'-deoxynucleotidase YfbR-like HD superfamily hydrolase